MHWIFYSECYRKTIHIQKPENPQEQKNNADKLGEILKAKQEEYGKAEDSEDIERLVSEIEMFKFVLFLVWRKNQQKILCKDKE